MGYPLGENMFQSVAPQTGASAGPTTVADGSWFSNLRNSIGLQPSSDTSILGMKPDQFSALAGGMASAFAPKDSWQAKLGEFARGLGVTQLAAEANKIKAEGDLTTMKEFLKQYPQFASLISRDTGVHPNLDLNKDLSQSNTGATPIAQNPLLGRPSLLK